MVRAGVVKHPAQWAHGGYREIQDPPERYTLIDLGQLSALCGFASVAGFQRVHRQWVEDALRGAMMMRDDRWSEAIAVGSHTFVERIKRELGIKARHREIDDTGGACVLREPQNAYTGVFGIENSALRTKNMVLWAENPANA